MQEIITAACYPNAINTIDLDTPKAFFPLLYGVKPFLKAPVKQIDIDSEHYVEEEDPDFVPESDDDGSDDDDDEFSSEADDGDED
jgi:hypothetical protein